MKTAKHIDFTKFLEDFLKDEDVWNMSLEEYNRQKAMAKAIYEALFVEA